MMCSPFTWIPCIRNTFLMVLACACACKSRLCNPPASPNLNSTSSPYLVPTQRGAHHTLRHAQFHHRPNTRPLTPPLPPPAPPNPHIPRRHLPHAHFPDPPKTLRNPNRRCQPTSAPPQARSQIPRPPRTRKRRRLRPITEAAQARIRQAGTEMA